MRHGSDGTALARTGIRWWGLLSSAAAPVLLIVGWTVAAALQPGHFDPVTKTISALAARGAADRWVMTAALAGVGVCYLGTGAALQLARLPGRLLLMAGGAATIAVAANPLPAGGGGSLPHGLAAAAGSVAMATWPGCAGRRGTSVPVGLRPAVSVAAALALLGLLGWFAVELWSGGSAVGLAERTVAGAEATWPLAVVLTGCWPAFQCDYAK